VTYIQPFTLLFLAINAMGLWGLRRHWRTASWRIAVGGFLGLVALSWPPAAVIVAKPLTARYPKEIRPRGDADAIVVLAGAVDSPNRERPYTLMGRDTYRRVQHAAWLFHNWRALPVLTTGGPESRTGQPAARVMRRMLEQEGVPGSQIWTEEQSRSTYENALYSARLLHEHGIRRIALVVEADSMLRAEMCFRKQGLTVTPAPCLFRDYPAGPAAAFPGWQGIYRQEILLHEAIGLAWYWLRGRI
jgi:uncharacterized SAM-binding protein YcdF (DUF218 family)